MPRSPTNYTLPPGSTPVVPDTVIQSAIEQAFREDVAQTFNTPQPIEFGGTNATTAAGARTNLGVPSFAQSVANGNIGLAASVAANALTISLKGTDGNDPSASNLVTIPFRDAALTTGGTSVLTASAATAYTIASGSTMGFISGSAGRLWIVAFNNSGTLVLGAVNVLSGTDIMPLRNGIMSSFGGSGNAAQAVYSSPAVASKAMTILGYMDWGAGLTTAGTWIAPTYIQVANAGTPLPCDVVQSKRTSNSLYGTGAVLMPYDDTIPQITEGDEFMSVSITPTSSPNVLATEAKGLYQNSNSAVQMTQAIFRDAVSNALAANGAFYTTGGGGMDLSTNVKVKAASISTSTISVRAGGNIAGTTRFNGQTSRIYGGVANSYVQVEEIMA